MTLRVARAAKVIGMPVTQADCERVMTRLGFAWTAQAPARSSVTPPSWRFDIADRGRPDRGSDPPDRLRRLLDATPPLAPITARVCRARRGAAAATVRHQMAASGLAGDDQLQLRRGALGARPRGQRRPDPRRQSDRRARWRDALEPGRQPGAGAASSTSPARRRGCACSRSAGVHARRRGGRDATRPWPAFDSRCASAAWPGATGGAAAMGRRRAPGRLLRRQGRRRGAARAACRLALRARASIPRCIRGAARAIERRRRARSA